MDAASIDEYVEHLKFTERDPVSWLYDREADVLYISFGELEPGIAADAGGVLIRFRESDGVIIGITIIGVSHMLAPKRSPKKRPSGATRGKSAAKAL